MWLPRVGQHSEAPPGPQGQVRAGYREPHTSPEKSSVPKSVLSPQRQQQAEASELANAMELSVREELRLADTF